ncbi:hypothetical protein Dimus_028474 [Dionaea muscipula]
MTIYNSCSLRDLEGSLIHPISEWRPSFKAKSVSVRNLPSETLGISVAKFPNEASEVPLIGCLGSSSFAAINLIVTNLKLLFQEYLWGPSHPNQSPILNLSIRKGNVCSSTDLELSISVQHVCCIIPPEYLAILIGYFSLPDWSSKENDDLVVHDHADMDKEADKVVSYKFEVLNPPTILCPVENSEALFLKLESPQLYCRFIQNDSSDNLLNGVSSECMVPTEKMENGFDALNLFGRDLRLSVLRNGSSGSLMLHETGRECCTLIQSSVLIYGSGFDALLEMINQDVSTVERQSRCFHCDIPQFLQLKTMMMENPAAVDVSCTALTEIKVYANLLSLRLCKSSESNSQEMVAQLDTGFVLSATLENEVVSHLDIQFSLLVLHSFLMPVTLLKCIPDSSVSPVLKVHP